MPTVLENTLRGYDANKALQICELIAEGMSIREICALDGMPSRPTVYRWMATFEQFAKAIENARTESAMSFEDMALDLAAKLKGSHDFSGPKIRAIEIAMAQYRWSSSRRDPKRYGAVTQQNPTMQIQINSSLNLGAPGEAPLGSGSTGESIWSFTATPIPEDAPEVPNPAIDLEPQVDDSGALSFGVPKEPDATIKVPKRRGRPPGPAKKGHKPDHVVRMQIGRMKKKGTYVDGSAG